MGVTGTNGIPRHPPTNNFKVMAAAARRIGYTDVRVNNMAINSEPRDGRNACDQIGFCMQGCVSGAKWSTANSELPRAEASGRCELRAESMVLRIEHGDDGRVRGVLYVDRDGREHVQAGARGVCRRQFDRDGAAVAELGVERLSRGPGERLGPTWQVLYATQLG